MCDGELSAAWANTSIITHDEPVCNRFFQYFLNFFSAVDPNGGEVISGKTKQNVEVGKAAKAPEDPVKPSDDYYDYVFKGWQLDFDKVESDMTIAPNFEPVLKEQN